MVLLTVLGKQTVIILAGIEFLDTIPVLYIMNFMILVVVITNIVGNQLFMALNKEKWTLISVIAGVILNIILNAVLIPYFAAKGAAIASVLSEGLVALVQLVLLAKIYPLGGVLKSGFIYLFNSLIMGIIIWCFLGICELNVFFQGLISVIIGCSVYVGLLLIEKNSLACEMLVIMKNKLKMIH